MDSVDADGAAARAGRSTVMRRAYPIGRPAAADGSVCASPARPGGWRVGARAYRVRAVSALAGSMLMLAAAGCSDGGSPGAASTPTATAAPAAQARRVAHVLEHLERAGARARAHHTVVVELQHPAGEGADRARRVIPYRFDHAATRMVCLAPGDGAELRIELRRSGSGNGGGSAAGGSGVGSGDAEVTLTREVPCRQMRFEAGDYEAHLHHLGGPQTGAVHVFAQPRYAPMDADAPLGSLLQRSAGDAAVKSAARSASVARKDTGACALIDTIALRNNATGTYFRTTLPARFADYFEMYRVSAAGLIAAPEDTAPTADSMLSVYSCGDAPDGVLKFANQHGVFLQSRCGYPMFSATSIDDATAYRPVWTPAFKRLDLINDANDALLTGVARSAGRVINGSSPQNADAQPGSAPVPRCRPTSPIRRCGRSSGRATTPRTSRWGTTSARRRRRSRRVRPFRPTGSTRGTSEGLAPSDGPMTMVAEFAYRPMGTVLSLAPVHRSDPDQHLAGCDQQDRAARARHDLLPRR
jgi:hypothetical protein